MSYRAVAILSAAAAYESRLLGGAYLGYGIVSYLTRGTFDRQTQRAVAAGKGWAFVAAGERGPATGHAAAR